MIAIRKARPADAIAIGAVHVAAWRSTYPGILPDSYLARLSVSRHAAHYDAAIRGGTGVLVAAASTEDLAGGKSSAPARTDRVSGSAGRGYPGMPAGTPIGTPTGPPPGGPKNSTVGGGTAGGGMIGGGMIGGGMIGGGTRVIGFTTASRANVREISGQTLGDGEVETLYLLDDWRERGVGRRLLRAAAEHLVERGCRSAFLWVLRDNPNRWFYQRLGGRPVLEATIRVAGRDVVRTAYVWDPIEQLLAASTQKS